MSYMDLANAQISLDRDRENVEATARKLYTYCAALRERIARYYGTMATAEKQAAFVAQREQLLYLMDECQQYLEYAQDESAWSNLDYAPTPKPLEELDAVTRREKLPQAGVGRTDRNPLVYVSPLPTGDPIYGVAQQERGGEGA